MTKKPAKQPSRSGGGSGGGSSSSSPPAARTSTPPLVDGASTLGMSSGSVSASFPYIPLSSDSASAVVGAKKSVSSGKWTPSSSVAPVVQPGHTRLGSLSSLRPKVSPAKKAHAEQLVRNLLIRQSAERGVTITDPMDPQAAWRTDDTLLSPEIWTEYEIYPQITDILLAHGDPELVDQAEIDELYRFMSLCRFGEIEQNAWKLMKRICGQKKNSRVSHHTMLYRVHHCIVVLLIVLFCPLVLVCSSLVGDRVVEQQRWY
jgi:hypothetical protein